MGDNPQTPKNNPPGQTTTPNAQSVPMSAERMKRAKVLSDYKKSLIHAREVESRVRESNTLIYFLKFLIYFIFILFFFFLCKIARIAIREFEKEYNKSEDDLKALQSVGQVIAEVLKQLDEERCFIFYYYFFSLFFKKNFTHKYLNVCFN